ncbi:tetratricopeptide repeat protein [Nocardia sp. NPDC003482]
MQVFGTSDLFRVGELDPYRLGATSSAFGRAGEYGHRDGYVPRTANQVDERLAEALTGNRLVVVVGPSKAGKTRTLFEAIRAFDREARVVWPVAEGMAELASHPGVTDTGDTLVVWLDDLHIYLTSGVPLSPAVLARWRARRGRTILVATLRSEMRARLRAEGELRLETRMLLEQALIIDLASTSEDSAERAAAARAYGGRAGGDHGLGEVLAGAPELLARYDDARAADPLLYAVIAVAVDWARIGRTDPIPEPILIDLALRQLRTTHPHIDATATGVRDAIRVARTPPPGGGRAAALRTTYIDDGTRGYTAFDYLIAADDGQAHRAPRPIPNSFWHNATRDTDAHTLIAVGLVAYDRVNRPAAFTLLRKAADAGDTFAMFNLGRLFTEDGDRAQAEIWLRKASDAGDTFAMFSLGRLMEESGDRAEAETWHRKAAEAGDTYAMTNFGCLLAEDGDRAHAEIWLRKAAAAGDTFAMFSLGRLFAEDGDPARAEIWLRAAAAAGDTFAMFSLGRLWEESGGRAEAKTWYRKAAEAGDTFAMFTLGHLLAEDGDRTHAKIWLRKAADAGNTYAMTSLGHLLAEDGDRTQAEIWLRKAADSGHTCTMNSLDTLCNEREEP